MIRHHDRYTKIEFRPVIVQTAIEHNLPDMFREGPAMISAECHEVLLLIALKMRKLSPIKSLRHKVRCGTTVPGCLRSEAPLCLKSSGNCGELGFESLINSRAIPE